MSQHLSYHNPKMFTFLCCSELNLKIIVIAPISLGAISPQSNLPKVNINCATFSGLEDTQTLSF